MVLPDQVSVICQLHLLWDVGLPNGLPQEVVRLTELDGYHDTSVHRFVEVIGSVGGHYDEAIMPGRKMCTWKNRC